MGLAGWSRSLMSDIIAMCLAGSKLGALDTDEGEYAPREGTDKHMTPSPCSDVSPGGNL